jgi:iron complex outermembrane receptor protein
MSSSSLRWAVASALGIAGAAVMSPSAIAQQAGARQALEEVVVTARRREESVQDLPMSIATFSEDQMELRGLEAGRDLNVLVPNVVVAGGGSGQSDSVIIMRGIPGVGIYVDGVWQGSRGALQTNFVEMQRVEVLRGPQGTLFGRNTNGGAIQYVTKLPGEEFGASFDVAIGDYDRTDIKGSVDLPLGENFFTKISAARLERDGYIKSIAVNRPNTSYGGQDDTLLRADLLWRASDTVQARLVINTAQQFSTDGRQVRFTNPTNRHLQAYNILLTNPQFATMIPGGPFTAEQYEPLMGTVGKWQSRSSMPDDGIFQDTDDTTLTIDWDINDNLHFKSITADRRRQSRQLSDWDSMEAVMSFTDDRNYDDNLLSEELQLTGSLMDNRMTWLAGFYYSDEENKFRQYRWAQNEMHMLDANGNLTPIPEMIQYIRDYAVANGITALTNYSPLTAAANNTNRTWNIQDIQDTALFGELSYDVSEQLNVTLGMRWSQRDYRQLNYLPDPTQGALLLAPPENGGGHGPGDIYTGTLDSIDELPDFGTDFTPKLSLTYDWTDNVMIYGSYAEGYSQGTTSTNRAPNPPIVNLLRPEVVATTEIGMRSTWADGRVVFNTNYFTSDWDGLRVPILPVDPVTGEQLPLPYDTDDGKAETSGLEAEVNWLINDQWQLNASVGFLDTKYLAVGDPDESPLRIGAPFQYAPETSYSIGLQYEMSLASGADLTIRGDYGWMDKYERDAAEQRQPLGGSEPAYGLLGMRAKYTTADGSWSASIFGSNLTDERYVNGGFDARNPFGLDFILVGRPREIGASLQFNFD